MQYLSEVSKMTEWSLLISKANHSVSQVCAPTINAKEAEAEQGRPTWYYRTNTPKRCPFNHRGLECKSRKSRDTWSDRQVWPWSIKWSKATANGVLPKECTGHSWHLLSTAQETTLHMDIIRRSVPKSDWVYSLQPKMKKLYTVSKIKNQSWLWLRSWTPYCQIQT